jgi:hypothetical protein
VIFHDQDERKKNAPLEPNAPGLPEGSYLGTCHGCVLEDEGKTLRCTQCLNSGAGRNYHGQERVDSRIGVKVCVEDAEWIGNRAGVLACEPRPVVVPPAATELPQGSAEDKVLINGAWMEKDDALFQVVMTGTVHDLRRILANGANVDAENPHQGRN